MTIFAIALPFSFEQPAWLWLCALVPLLVVASIRSLAGLDPTRRVLALIVRSVLVILIACCLAGIEKVRRNNHLTVMFLMDRSHSVQELQDFQESFIRQASEDIPADDKVGLIDFARHAYLQQLPMHGGFFIPPGRLPAMPNTDRTDVASAMRLAMAMFPHDSAKRIVLMSDGNDNMGDLLTEARRAKADGIPVDVVPLWYQHRNEVYFDRMIAPTHAEPGEQITIRMILHSYKACSGTISIFQNNKLVTLTPEQSQVNLKAGNNTFFMKLTAQQSGTQTYKAIFRPDNESMDAVSLNNIASAFTFVSGASKALLISNRPNHDIALVEALRSEKVGVDMIDAADLGEFGLLEMMNYATIILANVPAATFTEQQQQELAIFVKDMGSGLIMLGGDEGFGAGGWIGSPVEEVMPVTFEIKHKRVIPRGALVLIMHSCEIPRGNYWGKEMAKKSVDTISSQDYFGVLAYTYSPGGNNWEIPLNLATNKQAVKSKIDGMQIGDMPDFGTTMGMAYKELTRGRGRDAAQKHVIILSDGDAQGPSPGLIQDYVKSKITVSTISIGWGAHVREGVMRNISSKTGGKHYNARNPKQLPQIFVKESKVVRRPLIIDEPFQPTIYDAFSDLLTGMDVLNTSLPTLGGMVLTSPKQSPNVIIPIVRSTTDGDDPVLSHWQYELGKTVAFASGYWPVWGKDWTQWGKFAKFWSQIVRWTMRQESPANFDTYTKIEGGRGKIVIDALDKDASYLNNLQLRANIIGADHQSIPLRFVQKGPGNYQAEFDAEKSGQYLTNVQIYDNNKMLGTVRTGLSVPFSPEYRDLTPNESLLRQVADVTGGRWLDDGPKKAEVFRHDLPPTKAKRPVWDDVLAWLWLPAFLLDVSVRRLASWLALSIAVEVVILVVLLFGLELWYAPWWGIVGAFMLAELIGWTIRFRYIGPLFDFITHGVTVMAHTGERSEAALEHLRGTRERIRDQLDATQEQGPKRLDLESEPTSATSRKRRYDVGDEKADQPLGDLRESVGGAKKDVPPEKKDQTDLSTEQESTTSRLLRSRRRKKQDDN